MITIGTRGLDLYYMTAGERCRIVTSAQGVRVLWPDGEIETEIAPCGKGSVWLKDQWQDDHWLSLAALKADAVYEVEAHKRDPKSDGVDLILREIDPEAPVGFLRSGGGE